MKVLFAAAEMAPIVRVGGLAEAAGGLVRALRRTGVPVEVVLPDYGGIELEEESRHALDVPAWVGRASVRAGTHPAAGQVFLVETESMARSHPYVDESGEPWPDNDERFMRFAAAVGALSDRLGPDVLHLNDWHTAAVTVLMKRRVPTILTIHTLGYQGVMDASWLKRLPRAAEMFEWYGGTNPLAGGIRLADIVTTVSPNYAAEIVTPEHGMAMDEYLAGRGDDLVGILNGIDVDEWDPSADPLVEAAYDAQDLAGKEVCRSALLQEVGWEGSKGLVVAAVSRLVHQKGIDLLLEAVPFLEAMPARLVVLGSGEPQLTAGLQSAAAKNPDRVWFYNAYDVALAHRIFAGADLFVMPSRFEPCGLAQMQAMAYGTIPVVTPVGGLVDTVVDADTGRRGNGFVSRDVSGLALVDALHRAVRAAKGKRRRRSIQKRGMTADWSWNKAASEYARLYQRVGTA